MSRLAVCVLLAASTLLGDKKPVTLEVVANPPVSGADLGDTAWAPDGDRLAYAQGKQLWVYDASKDQRKELGSLEPLENAAAKPRSDEPFPWDNRRVVDNKIQWTPDGSRLVLHVGGDLFLWTVASGQWTQLTNTPEVERNPAIAPDGSAVTFQRSNELHAINLASKKSSQLTSGSTATIWNARLDWVYPEELALGTAHWWSPDSKQIAFLQFDVSRQWIYPHANLLPREAVYEPQRYPKAGTPNATVRLGVIPSSGGKVRWLDWGGGAEGLLARVHWLPDSRWVAVQRLNRVQDELALVFIDAATGAAKTVISERSRYWMNISDDLRFLSKREAFLWSSEKSGYRHLYLHGYDGRELQQLTSGEWEVKSVAAVDENRAVVYYHSRERSPLLVDLAAVDLSGGARRLVLPEKGQHSVSLAPGARFLIDTFSSAADAPRKIVRRITGKQLTVLQDRYKAADQYEIVRPEIVEVKAADGAVMYGRVLKPSKFDASRKYPAVVMVYGGPHAQSVCDCWAGFSWDQALAQRGFVVWQLDNRGTAGRGHPWESKLYRRFGKQELEDQEAGIRALVALGYVDPARIGMYGWSYGGFMTLYTMLNAPELIRAGIAGAPVTDWRNYDTIYTERYLGLPAENEEGYRDSSPVHQAKNLKGALMLAHNFEDDNVLFQHAFQMMVELQKAGKQFETQIYPQRSHGVSGEFRKHMLEAMTGFFERHLKPGS